MPAVFQPSSNLAPSGPVRRAGSAVLLCLLGLLLALGASTIFWVVFAAAVVVVMALGTGGDGAGGREGVSPVAHFGLPAEFHLTNGDEDEMAGIGEQPQVRSVAKKNLICTVFCINEGGYRSASHSHCSVWTCACYGSVYNETMEGGYPPPPPPPRHPLLSRSASREFSWHA